MTRRKDRVLNTRIPEQLDRELRAHAARLEVSVSELVRDVLGRTADLVGNLSGNVESLVSDMVEDVDHLRRAGMTARAARTSAVREIERSVLGWQELTLARPTRCALTGEELPAGARAHVGLRADGKPSVTISQAALDALLTPPARAWRSLVVQQPATCALTQAPIGRGQVAWFDPGSSPICLVSQDAYDRLLGGESEESIRGAAEEESR